MPLAGISAHVAEGSRHSGTVAARALPGGQAGLSASVVCVGDASARDSPSGASGRPLFPFLPAQPAGERSALLFEQLPVDMHIEIIEKIDTIPHPTALLEVYWGDRERGCANASLLHMYLDNRPLRKALWRGFERAISTQEQARDPNCDGAQRAEKLDAEINKQTKELWDCGFRRGRLSHLMDSEVERRWANQENEGITPLSQAIQDGNLSVVRQLLQMNTIDVNKQGKWLASCFDGMNDAVPMIDQVPLYHAVCGGNIGIVAELLEHPDIVLDDSKVFAEAIRRASPWGTDEAWAILEMLAAHENSTRTFLTAILTPELKELQRLQIAFGGWKRGGKSAERLDRHVRITEILRAAVSRKKMEIK